MKQYPVQFAKLPSAETMAYRLAGEGRPVLLIHGNQSASPHWFPLMERLENDFQLIAVDLIGCGDSSYNKRFDSLYELAVHVDQLMEILGLQSIPVIGWSTGGGVAMELAASFPERVSHLLLLSSVGLGGYPVYNFGADGKPILSERLCTKEQIAEHPVSVKPVLAAYEAGNREFMKSVWNSVIYQMKPVPDADFEIYLDAMFKQRNLIDIIYALSQFNFRHESNGCAPGTGKVDRLTMPVTILQGMKDLVVPYVWADEIKAALGDKATLHRFENGGHSLLTDSLDELETILKEAL